MRGAQKQTAERWSALADQYQAAARVLAEHLGALEEHAGVLTESAYANLKLPGLRLQCTALEYRLKAFICASRSGQPETPDLGRLLRLATFCGLTLSGDDRADVLRLKALHAGALDVTSAPDALRIHALCDRIAEQTRHLPQD